MAESKTTPKQETAKRLQDLAGFTVEMATESCGSVQIGVLRTTLRGRWSLATLHSRDGGAGFVGPAMSAMPDIPGVHLTINPAEMNVRVWDPLHGKPELCERISDVMKRARIGRGKGVNGIPEAINALNPDEMKTLIKELRDRVAANEVRVVEGRIPDEAAVAECQGRELFDLWSSNPHRPKYADEASAWERELATARI